MCWCIRERNCRRRRRCLIKGSAPLDRGRRGRSCLGPLPSTPRTFHSRRSHRTTRRLPESLQPFGELEVSRIRSLLGVQVSGVGFERAHDAGCVFVGESEGHESKPWAPCKSNNINAADFSSSPFL